MWQSVKGESITCAAQTQLDYDNDAKPTDISPTKHINRRIPDQKHTQKTMISTTDPTEKKKSAWTTKCFVGAATAAACGVDWLNLLSGVCNL